MLTKTGGATVALSNIWLPRWPDNQPCRFLPGGNRTRTDVCIGTARWNRLKRHTVRMSDDCRWGGFAYTQFQSAPSDRRSHRRKQAIFEL